MPAIERVGHVGIHVNDLDASADFYRDLLGFQITDEDRGRGMVFMSQHPEEEHHEVMLCAGRDVPRGAHVLQQMSFRCSNLSDVLDYWRRLVDSGATIRSTISHGNAISCYFEDPDGNNCEVYWPTGLQAHQPYGQPLDFNEPAEALLDEVRRHVAIYGETGFPPRERTGSPAPASSSE
jgi:catechol-2,3-dioxygenase